MKILKITPKFLLIALVFILLLGLAPMALFSFSSDVDESETTARISDVSANYGYDTGNLEFLDYTSTGNRYNDDWENTDNEGIGDKSVYSFQTSSLYGVEGSVWIQYVMVYTDGSNHTFDQTLLSNFEEVHFLNPSPHKTVSTLKLYTKGLATTRHSVGTYVWQAPLDTSKNTLTTKNLISENINSISLTYDISGGTTSSEYSLDGTTWTAISNSETPIEIDESTELYFKFVLSGSDPTLSNITYTADFIAEEIAPVVSSSGGSNKVVLAQAVSSKTLSEPLTPIETFRTYFQKLILSIFNGGNL